MGKYLTLVIFLTFFDSSSLFSQVGGRIVDAKTKQPLVGANIYTDLGVGVSVTDKKGEFMINNGELLRDADTLCFFFCRILYKTFFRNLFVAKEKCDSIARRTFCFGRSDGLWHKEILFTFTIYTNIIDACTAIFVCNDFIGEEALSYRWR